MGPIGQDRPGQHGRHSPRGRRDRRRQLARTTSVVARLISDDDPRSIPLSITARPVASSVGMTLHSPATTHRYRCPSDARHDCIRSLIGLPALNAGSVSNDSQFQPVSVAVCFHRKCGVSLRVWTAGISVVAAGVSRGYQQWVDGTVGQPRIDLLFSGRFGGNNGRCCSARTTVVVVSVAGCRQRCFGR